MNNLRVIGLNHHTAPIHVRERLAFTSEQVASLLRLWRAFSPRGELVVVSTCNRVEVYTASEVAPKEQMIRWLSKVCEVEPYEFQSHLFAYRGSESVRHLFAVASSLDSMIAGETQVLGQVRDALSLSTRLGAAGATLGPLFQRAISVGRQVLSDGRISGGVQGVAGAAVAFAKKVFPQLHAKSFLAVGAGVMGEMVLNGLSRLSPARLAVISRDVARAHAVAARFGGFGGDLSMLEDELRQADVVVSSTASKQPIVTRQMLGPVMTQRQGRPMLVVDIAVPRDVEHAAGEIAGVYLYDMDDLQSEVERSMQSRQASLELARQIVEREVDQYVRWDRARTIGPTIDAMYARGYQIASQELARLLGEHSTIDPQTRTQLEQAMRQTVNKLLHGPVTALKSNQATSQIDAEEYLAAVRNLFQIETQPPKASDDEANFAI